LKIGTGASDGERRRRGGRRSAGVLGRAVAGAAVAILYARTGEETRDTIGKKGADGHERGQRRGARPEVSTRGARRSSAIEKAARRYQQARARDNALSLWSESFWGSSRRPRWPRPSRKLASCRRRLVGEAPRSAWPTKIPRRAEADLRPPGRDRRDASRATALAPAQVERVDQLAIDLGHRLEQAFSEFQAGLAGSARKGGRC